MDGSISQGDLCMQSPKTKGENILVAAIPPRGRWMPVDALRRTTLPQDLMQTYSDLIV